MISNFHVSRKHVTLVDLNEDISFEEPKSGALNNDGTFQCASSNEIIPQEYFNDDYCDCDDGSDEPFTNACSHILTSRFVFLFKDKKNNFHFVINLFFFSFKGFYVAQTVHKKAFLRRV